MATTDPRIGQMQLILRLRPMSRKGAGESSLVGRVTVDLAA